MSFKHNIFVVERFPFCFVLLLLLLYVFFLSLSSVSEQFKMRTATTTTPVNQASHQQFNYNTKKLNKRRCAIEWEKKKKKTQRFKQFRGDVVENDINCILCVLFCTVFPTFSRSHQQFICVWFSLILCHIRCKLNIGKSTACCCCYYFASFFLNV